MAKLDKQNRFLIPHNLIHSSSTDFSKEVRLYIRQDDFYLDNPSSENRMVPNLGVVTLDSKCRLGFIKSIREFLKLDQSTEILCYLLNDKVTFRKV